MKTSFTCTALDLLETVIEFTNMTSDEADWSFEKQKYNDPRMVRLMQIWSLMGAFTPELLDEREIGESINELHELHELKMRLPKKKKLNTVTQRHGEITNCTNLDGLCGCY